jgi:hypothetical protein
LLCGSYFTFLLKLSEPRETQGQAEEENEEEEEEDYVSLM